METTLATSEPLEVLADNHVDAEERAAEWRLITPEIADAFLAKNLHNRPLSEKRLKRYAADMAAGVWRENGDPIRFSDQGRLIDGQTRLSAIVRSGVAQRFVVVYGVRDAHVGSIDMGQGRRSAADIVYLTGRAPSDYTVVESDAPIAKRIFLGMQTGGGNTPLHARALADLIVRFLPAIQKARLLLSPAAGDSRLTSTWVYAAFARASYHLPSDVLARFVEVYVTGFTPNESERAALMAREFVLTGTARLVRTTGMHADGYGRVARTLYLFSRGESTVKFIKAGKTDLFPLPGDLGALPDDIADTPADVRPN